MRASLSCHRWHQSRLRRMFAKNRKECLRSDGNTYVGRFTLSHTERCFGTHMKIEEMIAEDECSNVNYYIDAMWSTRMIHCDVWAYVHPTSLLQ